MKDLKEHLMESLQINEGFGYRNLKAVAKDITDIFNRMKKDGGYDDLQSKNLDPWELFELIRKATKGDITDKELVAYFTAVDDGEMWEETLQPDDYKDEATLAKALAEDITMMKEDGNLEEYL